MFVSPSHAFRVSPLLAKTAAQGKSRNRHFLCINPCVGDQGRLVVSHSLWKQVRILNRFLLCEGILDFISDELYDRSYWCGKIPTLSFFPTEAMHYISSHTHLRISFTKRGQRWYFSCCTSLTELNTEKCLQSLFVW